VTDGAMLVRSGRMNMNMNLEALERPGKQDEEEAKN